MTKTGEEEEAENRLAQIQNDLASVMAWMESRLGSIAEELRRAEARDEWMTTQLSEARRSLRRQNELLEEVAETLAKNAGGFC